MQQMKRMFSGTVIASTHHHQIVKPLSLRNRPRKKKRNESLTKNSVTENKKSAAVWIFKLRSNDWMNSGVITVVSGVTLFCW